ncbi:hypothetical protein BROUX41_005460 [Berkeleyomyces rouxiae]|uniref:uncharacterized protein n=1 Tax=Berkeleyomyces rouxiae TaxID=2035830 RepID=UPI003B7DDCB1
MTTPTAASDSPVAIYAELLATLRQISVHIRLATPADASTRVRLADGGQRLLVSHGAHTQTLLLPAAASAHAPVDLPLTAPALSAASARRSAAWKLPLAPAVALPHYAHELHDVPWEARDLRAGAEVRCRACEAVVVPASALREWKDLPSENWAEMMEFWHCHKPHVPPADAADGREERLTERAYGANATIVARKGVGFVDLTSFLLVEDDVQGVKFSPTPTPPDIPDTATTTAPQSFARPPPTPVHCAHCASRLGSHDAQRASIALFKWQVTTPSSVAPPASTACLAASLLAGMARSGYAKSVLVPAARVISSAGGEEAPAAAAAASDPLLLHLWIMNPSTTYSASGAGEAVSAMRLMFKMVSRAEADRLLDGATSDVQELVWPREAIADALRTLQRGFEILPAEAREFRDWKVSMLDKWQRPA